MLGKAGPDCKSNSIPGDLYVGTEAARMVIEPFIKPDDPKPATARATINIFDEVEIAHRSEPNSKIRKKKR